MYGNHSSVYKKAFAYKDLLIPHSMLYFPRYWCSIMTHKKGRAEFRCMRSNLCAKQVPHCARFYLFICASVKAAFLPFLTCLAVANACLFLCSLLGFMGYYPLPNAHNCKGRSLDFETADNFVKTHLILKEMRG